LTDVGDVGEHPLFDPDLNESSQDRANQLDYLQVSDRLEINYKKSLPTNVERGGTFM
jgi:hypothetical protein